MGWAVQREPPSAVVMTAAPLGAPAVPTVEPTAQQCRGPAQSTAVSELTGAGSVTVLSAPVHGDPGAMVDGAPELGFELLVAHADTARAMRATVNEAAARERGSRRNPGGRRVRRRSRDHTDGPVGREGGAVTEAGPGGVRSLTLNPGRFPGGGRHPAHSGGLSDCARDLATWSPDGRVMTVGRTAEVYRTSVVLVVVVPVRPERRTPLPAAR